MYTCTCIIVIHVHHVIVIHVHHVIIVRKLGVHTILSIYIYNSILFIVDNKFN